MLSAFSVSGFIVGLIDSLWGLWIQACSPIPYGDPYIACMVAIGLIGVLAWAAKKVLDMDEQTGALE